MKIKTNLRHFQLSAMTVDEVERRLERKFAFLKRSIKEEDAVEFKIKKKNPRKSEENRSLKHVYEVRIAGKLKTGEDFFFTKESIDLLKGIDMLANVTKEEVDQIIRKRQEKKFVKKHESE